MTPPRGYLSILVLGMNFPESNADALTMALAEMARADQKNEKMTLKMAGFFLGSAYEYGVGARPDPVEALKWYRKAADAGDDVARQQAARLQQKGQGQ
jgi:TPR repeat protein